jgi:hypothetical protein
MAPTGAQKAAMARADRPQHPAGDEPTEATNVTPIEAAPAEDAPVKLAPTPRRLTFGG